jgi:hypothetical protein
MKTKFFPKHNFLPIAIFTVSLTFQLSNSSNSKAYAQYDDSYNTGTMDYNYMSGVQNDWMDDYQRRNLIAPNVYQKKKPQQKQNSDSDWEANDDRDSEENSSMLSPSEIKELQQFLENQ